MEQEIVKTGCDIQKIAEEKLQLIISNGTIEKLIEDKITETCKSIIDNLLRDYSEFGKQLKEVLSNKLQVNLNTINLGTYSGMIVHVIEESMIGILETHKEKAKKTIQDILQVPEKTEWKLSEIVAMYRENLYEHPEVCIEVEEPSYSSRWIRIGEKKKTDRYSSQSQNYELKMILDEKTKKISNVWYNDDLIDPRKERVYKNSMEAFLMNLWAYNCTIELDIDEAEWEATKKAYED